MVQMLRNDKSAMGLVTGNGGFATKHSAGLYSATAPKKPFQLPDLAKLQAEVDAVPATKIAEVPSGKATRSGGGQWRLQGIAVVVKHSRGIDSTLTRSSCR